MCRGEAEAVSGEDGGRVAVASGDPWERLVVEAHVGGGDNSAMRRDPDQIAADDVWRAADEGFRHSAGNKFVVSLADLFGDNSGAAKGEMVHHTLAAAGDDFERGYLGFAVGDQVEGGGGVSDRIGPERWRGAREQHVVSRNVGDHADAPLGDAVDGLCVGWAGCVRYILTLQKGFELGRHIVGALVRV